MIFIDSNILVFACNPSSKHCNQARDFMQQHISEMVVSHQIFLESFRVLTHPVIKRKHNLIKAEAALMRIINHAIIVTPTPKTLLLCQEFIKKYKISGNHVFDAYLAATALTYNVDIIATENVQDFSSFPIKTINPFA